MKGMGIKLYHVLTFNINKNISTPVFFVAKKRNEQFFTIRVTFVLFFTFFNVSVNVVASRILVSNVCNIQHAENAAQC